MKKIILACMLLSTPLLANSEQQTYRALHAQIETPQGLGNFIFHAITLDDVPMKGPCTEIYFDDENEPIVRNGQTTYPVQSLKPKEPEAFQSLFPKKVLGNRKRPRQIVLIPVKVEGAFATYTLEDNSSVQITFTYTLPDIGENGVIDVVN